MFIDFRQRGGEKEHTSTREWTCNLGMYPDQEWNHQPFGVGPDGSTNWAHRQGLFLSIENNVGWVQLYYKSPFCSFSADWSNFDFRDENIMSLVKKIKVKMSERKHKIIKYRF